MRIFIGTRNTANMTRALKKGFTLLGHEATVGHVGNNIYYGSDNTEIDVSEIYNSAVIHEKSDGSLEAAPSPSLLACVEPFDLFVFIASGSLYPRLLDLPILQSLGKKIVCIAGGSELRHMATAEAFWAAHGHQYPMTAATAPPNSPLIRQPDYRDTFTNKLYNTRMVETYATTICSNTAISSLAIRPYMAIQLPFDMSGFVFSVPKNIIPKILHSPTSERFKRTGMIVQALDELRKEGIPLDLTILRGVPNQQVCEALASADIVIDQVACGGLGRFALEGLVSGCLVVSGNSRAVPWPPDRPAISVTPGDLKHKLREILTTCPDEEARSRARDWVIQYHSPVASAQAVLDALQREEKQEFDYYPTIFADIAKHDPLSPQLPFLQKMTARILEKHGIHPGINPYRLSAHSFLPKDQTFNEASFPTWDSERMHRLGPWNWCGLRIPLPSFDF